MSQLRYAVAVDRFRSFREAAKHCHISQPALSMQVQKLEETLGSPLFDRAQPIALTDVGERVLAQARVVLREAERLGLIAEEAHAELGGAYRLGIIPTLASSLLPLLLPRFTASHPAVQLVIEEVQTEIMLERLRHDDLDGGLASTPLHAAGIEERLLFRETLHLYLPKGHRLTKRKRIHQHEILDETLWLLAEGHCFGEQVLKLCEVRRPASEPDKPGVIFQGGGFETLIELVNAGFGMTVLPQLVVDKLPAPRRRAQVRAFASPTPMREVGFLHARRHLRRGIADAIVDTLTEVLPAARGGARRVLSPLAV